MIRTKCFFCMLAVFVVEALKRLRIANKHRLCDLVEHWSRGTVGHVCRDTRGARARAPKAWSGCRARRVDTLRAATQNTNTEARTSNFFKRFVESSDTKHSTFEEKRKSTFHFQFPVVYSNRNLMQMNGFSATKRI